MSREDWIEELPKGMRTAEVGVQKGLFSKLLIEVLQPSVHYMIDCWQSNEAREGDIHPYKNDRWQKLQLFKMMAYFQDEIKAGIARPILDFSLDAVKRFDDNDLDFIYIDALHTEEACYADMEAWVPKVAVGGYVAGHDYHDVGPGGECGVPQAVTRFAEEHGYEVHLVEDRPLKMKRRWWYSHTWWFKKDH